MITLIFFWTWLWDHCFALRLKWPCTRLWNSGFSIRWLFGHLPKIGMGHAKHLQAPSLVQNQAYMLSLYPSISIISPSLNWTILYLHSGTKTYLTVNDIRVKNSVYCLPNSHNNTMGDILFVYWDDVTSWPQMNFSSSGILSTFPKSKWNKPDFTLYLMSVSFTSESTCELQWANTSSNEQNTQNLSNGNSTDEFYSPNTISHNIHGNTVWRFKLVNFT